MSVESLCTGSTAVVQLAANTKGAMGGNSPSYADTSTTATFLLQTATVQESLSYAARGEETIYNAMFATNPNLTPKNRLKVTNWMGVDISSSPRFLRVICTDTEGRPGSAMLWVVRCVEDTLERAS